MAGRLRADGGVKEFSSWFIKKSGLLSALERRGRGEKTDRGEGNKEKCVCACMCVSACAYVCVREVGSLLQRRTKARRERHLRGRQRECPVTVHSDASSLMAEKKNNYEECVMKNE